MTVGSKCIKYYRGLSEEIISLLKDREIIFSLSLTWKDVNNLIICTENSRFSNTSFKRYLIVANRERVYMSGASDIIIYNIAIYIVEFLSSLKNPERLVQVMRDADEKKEIERKKLLEQSRIDTIFREGGEEAVLEDQARQKILSEMEDKRERNKRRRERKKAAKKAI
jgi:hypothetical protein